MLFEDAGILSFGPEGEAEYGRKNFLELLSVFTSPPLFRVISGQKELGSVHESTFYKKQEGPTILLLAGRSWKTNHLDWNRRIAYVEPADEQGRSRWIGEGQFLSFRVCQAIRHILAAESKNGTVLVATSDEKSARFVWNTRGYRTTTPRWYNNPMAKLNGGPLRGDWRIQWSGTI